MMTRYENAQKYARYWYGHDLTPEQLARVSKQIFAKWLVNGATIGKKDGKTIVHKKRIVRNLP